jgi:hypothetical protein
VFPLRQLEMDFASWDAQVNSARFDFGIRLFPKHNAAPLAGEVRAARTSVSKCVTNSHQAGRTDNLSVRTSGDTAPLESDPLQKSFIH